MSARAEFFLNLAREAQQIDEVVRPALARGDICITDRSLYSQIALSAGGRGLEEGPLRTAADLAGQGLWPDLVLLIDVDPDLARMRKRASKIRDGIVEEESGRKGLSGHGLLVRVRTQFLRMAAAEPERFVVVRNEGRALATVVDEIVDVVTARPTGRPARMDAARPGALRRQDLSVAALMAGLTDRPVKTFAVGFRVPGAYDESAHAEQVARHFGADHQTLVVGSMDVEQLLPRTVYHLDEPIADYAAIPTFLLSEFARRHVKVVLTGEGADELFAGYPYYRFASLLRHYERLPGGARRLLGALGPLTPPKIAKALEAGGLDPAAGYRRLKAVFRPHEIDRLLAPALGAARNGHDGLELFRALFHRGERLDPLNRYLLADLSTWLPEDLLMKVDKMSMSVGLEARVPFLDHRLVELVAGMPSHLKWGREPKHLLRRAAAGLVPDVVLHRPKHGFTLPLDRWFRAECRPLA